MKKDYKYLNNINFPSDLKKIPESKLHKVADELREELINAVSVTMLVASMLLVVLSLVAQRVRRSD